VAECYACLSALPADREAMAFAARLSAPYLHALDCEYGVADEHNIAMRRFVATHCAACGAAATNHCARCKLVSYCGQACALACYLPLTTCYSLLTTHYLLLTNY
jgi:hypothetical protein